MTGRRFGKVLVANRGEIARRIARTVRALGLRGVAVYSDADADSRHVTEADEAVRIGPADPALSYLDIDRVLDAAERTGAEAIHPGYGFLAENPAFAEACAARGLVFIGPCAEAMRNMGDKARAKALVAAAGVPCLAGYAGSDQSDGTFLQAARDIGFPVMIKAVAGGGGRGMRRVEREADFETALVSARAEVRAAFGDDRLLLERAVDGARHVEIQVIADTHGNVVHLGERDCSIQRRHQKLIEESPSPAIDVGLRNRMGAVSVAAARSIGYVGAGTFEYLLEPDGAFHFIEMNTRLQVEHAVTEAVTGLDIVALQIGVAMGEPLPLTQVEVRLTGHAIEARLCAEDPDSGFAPQSGRLLRWHPTGSLRVDHALRDGADVTPEYDSMIARLIAHGASREDARQRLVSGLQETVAAGLRTNRDFLAACLSHHDFISGAATTGFVSANAPSILGDRSSARAGAAMRAAALLRAEPGLHLVHGFAAPLILSCDDNLFRPVVRAGPGGSCHVSMDGEPDLALTVLSCAGDCRDIAEDGLRYRAWLTRDADRVFVQAKGRAFDFVDLTLSPPRDAAGPAGATALAASITGRVLSVAVSPGEEVVADQVLVTLDAMKMEHGQVSPRAGRVKAVHVRVGDQVSAGAVLVEFEPRDETGGAI